ncbi:hypothetical protein N9N67_00875 [Bacteriovoracaceae bacterium]|nr:hypothetical protein [Bacteriovoracaceae bacterium]
MNYLFVLFILTFNLFAQLESKECQKVKAAFDIGSGTTKMKVAVVNDCYQSVEKVLFKAKEKVSYKEDLAKSPNQNFSPEILQAGKAALKKLVKMAKEEYKATVFKGVATSAFRDSKNSSEIIDYAKAKLGLSVEIIDQKLEAKLGFAGVLSTGKYSPKDIVVWDIGGGSMQMTSYSGNNNYRMYLGQLASVPFKNYIIEKLHKDHIEYRITPNPMGWKISQKAFKKARRTARRKIKRKLKRKIKKGKVTVVGIGGVHNYSLMGQMGLKDQGSYTYKQLRNWSVRNTFRTDKEIGGKYASTDASNLILVLGFMDALKVKEVVVEDVNLADGVLVYYK